MTTRRRLLAASLLVPIVPAALRAETPPRHPLFGPRWVVSAIDGVPLETDTTAGPPHVEFEPDGRFTAYNGCNTLTGTYRLAGERISFGDWSTTKMACHGPRHQLEMLVNGRLKGAETWRVEGQTLILAGKGGRLACVGRARPAG